METILVVDDMAIFRDPIAASLRLAGYQSICAVNGKDALQRLSQVKVSLILLDLSMPIMDGLEFLAALRASPETRAIPVIMLTALAEKEKVIQAARLGVQDYLLKSRFSLKELLERVRKRVSLSGGPASETPMPRVAPTVAPSEHETTGTAADPHPAPVSQQKSPIRTATSAPQPTEIPVLLTRDECLSRAKDALGARTLSGVVAHVISVAGSPRADLADLAGLIAKDSLLSARVLQVANSAAYMSSRGTVTTIGDAVRHIGCTTIRNIAAALAVFDAMPDSGPGGFNPIRCWQHSFGVATICAHLSAELGSDVAGSAYLAGLCHDLGEILFHTHFAPEYQRVLDVEAQTGKGREYLERRMLGTTRGELAMVILKSLGLPTSIQRPIELFHSGESLRGNGSYQLARILRLAETYTNAMLLASSTLAAVAPLTKAECRLGAGNDAPGLPDGDVFRSEVLCMTGLLARITSRDQARLLEPHFARASVQVLLVRDPALSPSDPVTMLFGSLAKVEIVDRLPHERLPSNETQALVVVSRSPAVAGLCASDLQALLLANPIPVAWIVQQPEKASLGAADVLQPTGAFITLQSAADFIRKARTVGGHATCRIAGSGAVNAA